MTRSRCRLLKPRFGSRFSTKLVESDSSSGPLSSSYRSFPPSSSVRYKVGDEGLVIGEQGVVRRRRTLRRPPAQDTRGELAAFTLDHLGCAREDILEDIALARLTGVAGEDHPGDQKIHAGARILRWQQRRVPGLVAERLPAGDDHPSDKEPDARDQHPNAAGVAPRGELLPLPLGRGFGSETDSAASRCRLLQTRQEF